MRHKMPKHLSAVKHIEETCAMTYMYFSNGLTWHIYAVVCCTRRKVYQAACEVPAKIYAQKPMALCSLWTTDLIIPYTLTWLNKF